MGRWIHVAYFIFVTVMASAVFAAIPVANKEPVLDGVGLVATDLRLEALDRGHPSGLRLTNGGTLDQEFFSRGWTLVFFGFTSCPGVCPLTLNTLQKSIPEVTAREYPVQSLFVSIDPERDSERKVATYLQGFGRQFLGAVGTTSDVRRFYERFLNRAAAQFQNPSAHSALVYVVAPGGRIMGGAIATSDAKQFVRKLNYIIEKGADPQ